MKMQKYAEVSFLILMLFIIFNIITTLLGYFEIFKDNTVGIINIVLTILILFFGGFYLGKKTDKKGWLEGLKIGLTIILLFFLLSYLGFDKGPNLKSLLYYLILLISPITGSMLGINKRKTN